MCCSLCYLRVVLTGLYETTIWLIGTAKGQKNRVWLRLHSTDKQNAAQHNAAKNCSNMT